jgi:SAM-dependent methyltransferase
VLRVTRPGHGAKLARVRDPVAQAYSLTPLGGAVLDVGCLGLRQQAMARQLGRLDLRHSGTDVISPPEPLPEDFRFRTADLDREEIPFSNDSNDLVVASHVLEHLRRPVEAFGELVRVCRPGGLVYVEAPSERTLLLPGMPFDHDKFFSLSFFDDPTHVSRPWTPQSLHRLAAYYGCDPLREGYRYSRRARLTFPWHLLRALVTRNARLLESCLWNTIGWASFAIVRKPESLVGRPSFRYYIPEGR